MDTPRSPRADGPVILDMTPDGEFRDVAPRRGGTWLDRALERVGGAALLITAIAGGLLLLALAFIFVSLVLPVLLAAGAVAAGALWWRLRRLRRQMAAGETVVTFTRRM